MSDIYNVWKGKGKLTSKSFSPMIGCVYRGIGKFFGEEVVGVLVEMFDQNDEAILRTKTNKLISVNINSLKIIVNE